MQVQKEPLTEKGQTERDVSNVRQLFLQLLHNYPDGAIRGKGFGGKNEDDEYFDLLADT